MEKYILMELLDESAYLDPSVITNGGSYLHEGQTIKLKEDEYFVCGDNRTKFRLKRFWSN
jgi:signal peptidase I